MAPRIVFGDDGSAAADVAWLWVSNQRWAGWAVDIVSAQLPDLGRLPVDRESAELHPWDPPHPRNAFAETGFDIVRHLTAIGDPRLVLGSCRDAALLVVGPRGPGVLKAVHLGSTAEWLLLRPPAPLIIVKAARQVRHVLMCMDGSADAWCALRSLARLPWLSQVQVSVLGAIDSPADVPSAVEAAAAELGPLAGSVQTTVAHAPATTAIVDALDHRDIDLVVLGTRGHTGFRQLALGSSASHVVRAARCSVLVATERVTDE